MLWFAAVMGVFFLLEVPLLSAARASDVKAIKWAWIGVMFATLGVAVLIAVGGMVFALIAIVRRKERSGLLLVPILLGAFVLYFGIGEAFGHEEPGAPGPGAGGTPAGGEANSHSNASAVEVAPGEVRVSFDYVYAHDPSGARIEAITVRPLGADGRVLPGYAPSSSPITPGSGHMDVVLKFPAEQLGQVTGFSICFSGPGITDMGCARVGYSRP